jgi:ribosomal protein L37E
VNVALGGIIVKCIRRRLKMRCKKCGKNTVVTDEKNINKDYCMNCGAVS